MLEISTVSAEERLGRDFADLFEQSNLARLTSTREQELTLLGSRCQEHGILLTQRIATFNFPLVLMCLLKCLLIHKCGDIDIH